MQRRKFILCDFNVLEHLHDELKRALQQGELQQCDVRPYDPKRSLDQNAKFHAIVADVARQAEYLGGRRSAESWKALFVSGHAMATKQGGEVLPGLEGEFVAIRESTAHMSSRRASSLIEYVLAWCAMNGIELRETA